MLSIKTNAASTAAALRKIADDFPREVGAGLSAAGLGLRKRIGAAMPSSSPPFSFSPLDPLTRASRIYLGRIKALKAARSIAQGAVSGFGGVLSLPSSFRYVKGRALVILTYIPALAPYAEKFQRAEVRPTTAEERHRMHKRGVHDFKTYRRQARPIFQPIADDPSTMEYVLDAVRKRIVALIEKRAREAKKAAMPSVEFNFGKAA